MTEEQEPDSLSSDDDQSEISAEEQAVAALRLEDLCKTLFQENIKLVGPMGADKQLVFLMPDNDTIQSGGVRIFYKGTNPPVPYMLVYERYEGESFLRDEYTFSSSRESVLKTSDFQVNDKDSAKFFSGIEDTNEYNYDGTTNLKALERIETYERGKQEEKELGLLDKDRPIGNADVDGLAVVIKNAKPAPVYTSLST